MAFPVSIRVLSDPRLRDVDPGMHGSPTLENSGHVHIPSLGFHHLLSVDKSTEGDGWWDGMGVADPPVQHHTSRVADPPVQHKTSRVADPPVQHHTSCVADPPVQHHTSRVADTSVQHHMLEGVGGDKNN